jgi:hypothetical protein
MPDVFKVADILVRHAVHTHQDEIAIIAYYGSYAKGEASPTSDLDIFFIPDEGKARTLSSTFIIDGLPYDFWPVSWSFATDIANARSSRPWAVSASLIADARVLHHRSQEDLERFQGLQARIEQLTRPESRQYMVGRALEAFKETLFQLAQLRLAHSEGDSAGQQWAGWNFVHSAVNCLALVNQTYFSKGWGANLSQISAIAQKPEGLEEMMRGIIMPENPSDPLLLAEKLAREVRGILSQAQASTAEPTDAQDVFKGFYYYVFEYVNKVLAACERKDVFAAGSAALLLQEQFCQLMNKVDKGFWPSSFNLLGEYVGGYEGEGFPNLLEPAGQGDLAELAKRARQLDQAVRDWFGRYSVELDILEDVAALRRFLPLEESG